MNTQFHEIDPSQFGRSWQRIPYASQDPLQILDIYLPGDEGNYPLIVYVNGGGWVQQLVRHDTVPGVWKAPSQGYALATVGHRLAPAYNWPAPVLDIKAALRFLRAHAHEYGYNADKIVCWGNSAGGHALNMCAATNGYPLYEDLTMGNPDQSSEIQGLVGYYAPSDLYQVDLATYILDEEAKKLAESPLEMTDTREGMNFGHNILLGCKASTHPAIAQAASPINFVTSEFPPAFYTHGMDDPLVPYTQTITMVNAINQACGKGRAMMHLFPGAGHGDPVIKADEVTKEVFDFIDGVFGLAGRKRPALSEVKVLS